MKVFNPFCLLTPELLNAFIASGKRYFVRQTFTRGFSHADGVLKGYFLFSHYGELGNAQQHYSVISNDKYRFLYDWDKTDHRIKLRTAASQPVEYKIYSSVFDQNWKAMITDILKRKVRLYVEKKKNWHPRRNDIVTPDIFVQYGELYARICWGNEEVRVKFEDIEKIA